MMILREKSGSILIWSLLLGLSLASVFFFFSQRLNQNSAAQRETIKYQNAVGLLESYADYLQTLLPSDLVDMRNVGSIDFEGITGFVTNFTMVITGSLDVGDTAHIEASIPGGDKVKIEWNLCDNNEEGIPITITPAPTSPPIEGNCTFPDIDYDAVSDTTDESFSLYAPYAPVSYRVSPYDVEKLYSNKWTMNLSMIIGSRKKVTVTRTWTP